MDDPSWAETARTALAAARVAALELRDCRAATTSTTLVRQAGAADGRPVVTLEGSSPAVASLAFCRVGTLRVAGPGPWTLRLVGTFVMQRPDEDGARTYTATPLSVRLRGPREVAVPVAEFLSTRPDPLAADTADALRHLETDHSDALVACARTHGVDAAVVLPQRLDRHGLELVALAEDGAHRLRLPFADGPVERLADVPAGFPVPLRCVGAPCR